ncbi:DUF1566 domain-containing protein [uncultured Thiodictyon sp.]|uniref:Lcl C-terminal domain-containing protein n=1 Tax=uncultured Thiodictyon sp. TaxID=1846217 RepID=UPI0025F0C6E7|nr:DUF1566 domain-containing protein [uncultured Thiodictyon sp.]
MVNADHCSRPRLPLVWLLLAAFAGHALAAQTCKYDSIPATAPASRFSDNGNGTVTDKMTGLQWQRCSEGQTWVGGTCTGTASSFTWQQALQYADTAIVVGKDDWRLPNINELTSIFEEACYGPAIDLWVFPATNSSPYWSSSPDSSPGMGNSGSAWFVLPSTGNQGTIDRLHSYRVRLVRGG